MSNISYPYPRNDVLHYDLISKNVSGDADLVTSTQPIHTNFAVTAFADPEHVTLASIVDRIDTFIATLQSSPDYDVQTITNDLIRLRIQLRRRALNSDSINQILMTLNHQSALAAVVHKNGALEQTLRQLHRITTHAVRLMARQRYSRGGE